MRAKITAYNTTSNSPNCSNFSVNTYWGGEYKNVFYLCGDIGRSTFKDTIETVVDANGQETRTLNSSVERYTLTTVIGNPYLTQIKTLGKHDTITLEDLDTGRFWNITNIDIEDDGNTTDIVQKITLSYEIDIISSSKDTDYQITGGFLGFWDNNDDATIDQNGSAKYTGSGVFDTWQLYYQTIPPFGSPVDGTVSILVYAEKDGASSLLGEFEGVFGDKFSDSTKWRTTQNLYNYFNLADEVGHRKRVQFAKQAFAEDYGYVSDELEDKAVDIVFKIAFDNSTYEQTTLEKIHSIWGSFNATGRQQPTGEYGITTISKFGQAKSTIQSQNDVSRPLSPSGAAVATSNISLYNTGTYTNEYQIGVLPSGETEFTNTFITNGGYIGGGYRGSYNLEVFEFRMNPLAPIIQYENTIPALTGTSPFDFQFNWWFERKGVYAEIGTVVNGTAGIYLNNSLYSSIAFINDTSNIEFGFNTVTLPSIGVHKIELRVDTTDRVIRSYFHVELKPLY